MQLGTLITSKSDNRKRTLVIYSSYSVYYIDKLLRSIWFVFRVHSTLMVLSCALLGGHNVTSSVLFDQLYQVWPRIAIFTLNLHFMEHIDGTFPCNDVCSHSSEAVHMQQIVSRAYHDDKQSRAWE